MEEQVMGLESQLLEWAISQGPVVVLLGILIYVLWKERKTLVQSQEDMEIRYNKAAEAREKLARQAYEEAQRKEDVRDKELQTYWEEKEEKFWQALEQKDKQLMEKENLLIDMQERAVSTYEKMAAALDRLTDRLDSKVVLWVLFYSLSGCVSYDKCMKKYGQLKADTVLYVDTLRMPVKGDTVHTAIHDTTRYFFEEKERTKLEVRRDSVFTFITCEAKADTVTKYQTRQVIREKPVFKDKPDKVKWWHWILMGLAGALLMMFVLRLIIR